MTAFRWYWPTTRREVELTTREPWDVVLDRVARDDPRKLGGPTIPPKEGARQ